MSLNKDFRLACIEAGYNKSCFTSEMHSWDDLQVCHILSKSKTTLNAIKKAYNCSSKTADLIMNMPLLNTVIGSRQDNAEYKKTEDIQYIDYKLLALVDIIYRENGIYNDMFINNKFSLFLHCIEEIKDTVPYKYNDVGWLKCLLDYIKDIQLQFHREINLHS